MILSTNKRQPANSQQDQPAPAAGKLAQQAPTSLFFQLAGHQECFKLGLKPGTILKRATGNEEACLRELMHDKLAPFVPKLFDIVKLTDGNDYLELQDLLANFNLVPMNKNSSRREDKNYPTTTTCVMDIKMGLRTCREDEGFCVKSGKHKLRPEMYNRMVEVDPNEPTDEERQLKMVTKQRYMIWRDNITSSASLGFRIEGIRFRDGSVDKTFQRTNLEEQILNAFKRYATSITIRVKYLKRLYELRKTLTQSKFFYTHELIGSSLLFVHNDTEANIWIIDFAKTNPLPRDLQVTHRRRRDKDNFEDGYLIGIDNLIRMFESIIICERGYNWSTSRTPTSRASSESSSFLKDSRKRSLWFHRTKV